MNNPVFIAWRSGGPTNGHWGPVGRLEHGPSGYRFVYTRGARTIEGFGGLTGMPDLNAVYESQDLFPVFANRILGKSRPEYQAFLTWGGFDPDNPPEPLALLSVTEGRRQTDTLEVFPCPQPDAQGCFLTKFFLHGVRWMHPAARERINQLRADETLGLMLDVSNQHDPNAVAVRTSATMDRVMIGYVPRYLAREVSTLCATCHPDFIDLRVVRVNAGAPLQQRVLCRMNACWPEGFQPCAGDEFLPIPTNIPPMAVRGMVDG